VSGPTPEGSHGWLRTSPSHNPTIPSACGTQLAHIQVRWAASRSKHPQQVQCTRCGQPKGTLSGCALPCICWVAAGCRLYPSTMNLTRSVRSALPAVHLHKHNVREKRRNKRAFDMYIGEQCTSRHSARLARLASSSTTSADMRHSKGRLACNHRSDWHRQARCCACNTCTVRHSRHACAGQLGLYEATRCTQQKGRHVAYATPCRNTTDRQARGICHTVQEHNRQAGTRHMPHREGTPQHIAMNGHHTRYSKFSKAGVTSGHKLPEIAA
jgi:hypothetical protein